MQTKSLQRYYLIDHKILFLFGYIFYLWTPYFLGSSNAFGEYPGVSLFQSYFQRISRQNVIAYVLITLSWLVAFYLGHFFFKLLVPYKRTLQLFPNTIITQASSYLGIVLFGIMILFVYVSRHALVGSTGEYNVGPRGKLSTLMIVYNFFLLYQLTSREKISYWLVGGTVITSLILLLSGGRLSPLQTFLAYLIYKTSFSSKRWKGWHLAVFAVIGFLVGTFIGVSRVGAGFSLQHAIFSFSAEPLFTWFSTGSFLAGNEIPLLNIPSNFLTSFINLIPNTIFNAYQFVVPVGAMGYAYANPFGADSIWTSLVINFGAIGSFFFIFLTGFMLNLLRHLSEGNHFWAVYYMLVCAMLPFEFFRTGFFILNKEIFFNFLFLPFLFLFVLKLLAYMQATKATLIAKN